VKPSFRSLAALKLVVNILSANFKRGFLATAWLSYLFSSYEPARNRRTDRRTGRRDIMTPIGRPHNNNRITYQMDTVSQKLGL